MSFGRPEWLLLALPLAACWWFFLRPDRRTRVARAALLGLGLLALADLRFRGTEKASRVTLLLDRSRSVRGRGLSKGAEVASLLARAGAAEVEVVGFGQGAALLSPAGEAPHLEGLPPQDETDLAAGLDLAAALAPGDRPQAVLLVSDGEYSGPDPQRAVAALTAKHVPVYVLPVAEPRPASDTAIASLEAPSRAVRGQPFPITVLVESPVRQQARVRLLEGPEVLADSAVQLEPGSNPLQLQWTAPSSGLREYAVEVVVAGDPVPENNRAGFALAVLGPPGILIANADGAESALAVALRRAGYDVTVSSQGLGSAARLAAYEAVILEDVSLDKLGDGADLALRRYVTELGGGLLVTGGRSSFAAGGYYKSALEELLPVLLDRPGELRRPRVALAITMDRSGSMSEPVPGGGTKMDLADRSAAEGVRLLQPDDEIAVFAVDSEAHRVVSLSRRGEDPQGISRRILSVESAGGGIFIYEALVNAMRELRSSSAPTRHVLLYADAADSEEPKDSLKLVEDWRKTGGTLSIVALGTEADSDAGLLKDLAQAGGGRVVFTNDPRNLPRAFAQQVMQVTRRTFEERTTPMKPGVGWAGLGMPGRELPATGGYNLTYLAPGAEELLRTGDENRAPLAASWQRGLGKVAAVTFEADGPFAGQVVQWPGYQPLFAHLLESIKRPASTPDVGVDLSVDGRWAVISVDLDPRAAAALTERPSALVFPPGAAEPFEVALEWRGPTELGGSFRLTHTGPYAAAVRTGAGAPVMSPPRTLAYSPEFAPGRGGARGASTLEAIAAATGGQRITHVDELRNALRAHAPQGRSLVPLLALLGIAVLLLDVALRRGLLEGPAQRVHAVVGPTLQRAAGVFRRRAPRQPRPRAKRASPQAGQAAQGPGPAPAAGEPQAEAPPQASAGLGKPAAEDSVFAIARERARKRRR